MSLILISSERFAEHQTPPGHPERPERAAVMNAVAARWRATGGEVVAPPAATREQLARVHDAAYLHRLSETSGHAVALDPDTFTSPESHEIALLAAGAAVDAVERVMGSTHTAALAMVRPPGHHAERNKAMGFCLFNNVAVAAAHARAMRRRARRHRGLRRPPRERHAAHVRTGRFGPVRLDPPVPGTIPAPARRTRSGWATAPDSR